MAPEQLTGAHLYLDIAKSGYPFHGYFGGMTLCLQCAFLYLYIEIGSVIWMWMS